MKMGLTQKQETFCVKYFELGNASEAARIAGYAPKWAGVNTHQLLGRACIQERLKELREKEEQIRQKIEMESVMSVLERKQILTELARANMIDFVEVGQDGAWFNIDETNLNSRALQSVQSKTVVGKNGADDAVFIRVNLHDPTKAIDLLNKMDKIYSDGYQDNRVVNRVVNVFVIDSETKDLISRVGERTKLINNGHENNQGIQSDP